VDIVERVRIGERIAEIDRVSELIRAQMRHIYYTELPVLDEEIDRERRELAQKIIPPPLKFWRIQKAREYYAKMPGKETPVPFAEFRVWVYTTTPEKWPEKELAAELNFMEYAFSVTGGRTHIKWAKAVYSEQSFESEPVDPEEVTEPLNEVQYYAVFYHKPHRRGKIELTPEQIKTAFAMAGRKIRVEERVRQLALEDWAMKEPRF